MFNQEKWVTNLNIFVLRVRRGPAQDVPFFYTGSRFSELQSCTLIFSANFSFIFIFK